MYQYLAILLSYGWLIIITLKLRLYLLVVFSLFRLTSQVICTSTGIDGCSVIKCVKCKVHGAYIVSDLLEDTLEADWLASQGEGRDFSM